MPFIDFAALKAAVPIDQAAQALGLTLKPEGSQFRSACPACKSGGDRAIVITPAKALFYCFSAKKGGDCIGLAAHVMGVGNNDAAHFLADQLGTVPVPDRETVQLAKSVPTAPQKPERRSQPSPAPFDPDAYAAKLTYTEEVEALGISEDDASRLSIGFSSSGIMRGRVCFPVRNLDGSISGFIGWNGTDLKVPTKWQHGNVVQLKRPA